MNRARERIRGRAERLILAGLKAGAGKWPKQAEADLNALDALSLIRAACESTFATSRGIMLVARHKASQLARGRS